MKDSYTIHEIAALYGVGPDALRYYEKLGLIRPRRAENGYRIYDLNDIYRLTILRDLRSLGFSMERITEYLRDLSVSNTLQLLDEERRLIRESKMRALRAAESAIRERVRRLQACAAVADGDPSLVELPPRPCLRLNADIARDEEMDFAIKRLHRRHEDTIRDLGGQKIGASIAPEDIRAGREGVYRSVFFLLKEGKRATSRCRAGRTRAFSTAAATGSWERASRRCFPGRGREASPPPATFWSFTTSTTASPPAKRNF